MKAINYACFKLEEKATTIVTKKKNNFINATGDKFTREYYRRKTNNFILLEAFQFYKLSSVTGISNKTSN